MFACALQNILQNPSIPEYKALWLKASSDENGIIDLNKGEFTTGKRFVNGVVSQDYAFVGERVNLLTLGQSVLCPSAPEWLKFNVVFETLKGTTKGLPISPQVKTQLVPLYKLTTCFVEYGFVVFVLKQLMGGMPTCFGFYSDTDIAEAEQLKLVGYRNSFWFLLVGLAASIAVFLVELIIGKWNFRMK